MIMRRVYAGDDTASFAVSSDNIEEFGVALCKCEECCCRGSLASAL